MNSRHTPYLLSPFRPRSSIDALREVDAVVRAGLRINPPTSIERLLDADVVRQEGAQALVNLAAPLDLLPQLDSGSRLASLYGGCPELWVNMFARQDLSALVPAIRERVVAAARVTEPLLDASIRVSKVPPAKVVADELRVGDPLLSMFGRILLEAGAVNAEYSPEPTEEEVGRILGSIPLDSEPGARLLLFFLIFFGVGLSYETVAQLVAAIPPKLGGGGRVSIEDFRLLLPTLDGKRFFAVDRDMGHDRLGRCPVDFSEPLAASLQAVGPADHIIVAERIRCAFAKSLRARGGKKNRGWLIKVVAQTEAISHALRELYDRLRDPQLLRLAAASDLVSSDRVGKRKDGDPNGRSPSKSVRAELRRARLEGHIDHEVALFRCIAPFVEASSHPYLDLQEAERYLLSACCLYGVLAQRPVWRSHLASHVQPATTNLLQKANDLIGRAEKAAADFPDKESVGRARNLSIIAKAVADALGSHEGQRTQDRSRRLAELVVHAATGSPYELPSGPLAFHQEVKKVLDVKPPPSLDSRRLHASIALSVFAAEASLADPGQHSWVAVAKDIDSALTSLAKEELQRLPPASTTFLVIDAIRALDASFGLDAREKGNRIAALRGRAEIMLGGQGRIHIERVASRLEHYNIMRSTFPEVHTIGRFMHLRRQQGVQPLPQRFDVFVSYSTADAGIARDVVDRLRERGLLVWVDFDGGRALESGTNRVADALLRCECVVVIVSETSRDRAFVQAEQGLRKEGRTVRLCAALDGAACKPGDIVFSSSDNAWFKELLTKIRGQD